jgi:glycopeptide antibiotics resistance protein
MAARDTDTSPGLSENAGAGDGGPGPVRESRTIERVGLGIYLLVLVWVVLLKIHTSDFGDLAGRRSLNLVPFASTGSGGLGVRELAVNVLAFVPLGVLLYLAARRRTIVRLLVPVVGVSSALEVVQYVTGIGASDVTDVLTKSAGGIIGVGFAWLVLRLFGERARRTLLITIGVVLVAWPRASSAGCR